MACPEQGGSCILAGVRKPADRKRLSGERRRKGDRETAKKWPESLDLTGIE